MKWESVLIGLSIASIIFLGMSLNAQPVALYEGNHYLNPHREVHMKIVEFGGELKVKFKITVGGKNASKNITIYLDGKKIPQGKWVSTGYIGVHTLVINSTKEVNMDLYVYSKGESVYIPISFGIVAALSALLAFAKYRQDKKYQRS